nr:MAG TPA: hypothetical protein [Caudoviricetes sp.]
MAYLIFSKSAGTKSGHPILWVKFYSRIIMLTSYQPNIFCESI